MNTPTTNHEPALLVDIETGRILEAPEFPVSTVRWVDSHPFVEQYESPSGRFVVAGPDAVRVAKGFGGTDFVLYEVDREIAGSLHLRKES